jgi:hypothetical protein
MLACVPRQANIMSNETTRTSSYDVGYKKPPLHTRFQKGNRANPNGRPKRDSNLITSLNQLLEEEMTVGGRSMTRNEATVRVVIRDAMLGNQKAFARFLKLAKRAGLLQVPKKPPTIVPRMTPQEKEAWLMKIVLQDVEDDERAQHEAEAQSKR